MSKVSLSEPVVSVAWLYENLEAENLIIFDTSIPKVMDAIANTATDIQLPNAQFFNFYHTLSLDFCIFQIKYKHRTPVQK